MKESAQPMSFTGTQRSAWHQERCHPFIILSEDVREEKEPTVQMKLFRRVCVWRGAGGRGGWYFI